MDITQFVVSRRNDALLVGDYGSYRTQLSRRLLVVRRKLGRTSPRGRKFVSKAPITAEDVKSNPEFIGLLLLTSERAWAHALYMKSLHSADSSAKAITGTTRRHIISRLHKAKAIAAHLVSLLDSNDQEDGSKVVLEARAYYCMMRGALEFESHKWEKCLEAYSEAHLLYTYFRKSSSAAQGDTFNELLWNTVDPSIRYAAYQLRLPRTLSISRIVAQFLPKDSPYASVVIEENPDILKEGASRDAKVELDGEVKELPKTITWRNRIVKLEDANIAQALAAVRIAEQKLSSVQKSSSDTSIKESAAAYDDVLSSSQDAVDSTNTAISELSADGIAQDDSRMQALQITRTAVNYALVGWRIGRNRVLCSTDDGIHPESGLKKKAPRARKNGKPTLANESNLKKLALFRERVTLYDTIIQSLDSVKELPGVAADQSLLGELHVQRSYFSALRCVAIGKSHALLDNLKNALALFAHAQSITPQEPAATNIPTSKSLGKPLNMEVTKDDLDMLYHHIEGLVAQHCALVEIEHLTADTARQAKASAAHAIPMIERLDEYPPNGVDLTNLVIYPPKLRPVPVKPLFLDVAWTYIDYPGRAKKGDVGEQAKEKVKEKQIVEEKKETRKGWFGFGR